MKWMNIRMNLKSVKKLKKKKSKKAKENVLRIYEKNKKFTITK